MYEKIMQHLTKNKVSITNIEKDSFRYYAETKSFKFHEEEKKTSSCMIY